MRQVIRVMDLETFTSFLRLAAGRTGQELNLSRLGSDVGVSHPTVLAWIGVLEASFVVFRLPPWIRNVRKRVVKTPKLHFVDTGLACHLLGIRSPDQLRTHPLRGALFESWVASEVRKARLHARRPADLFHLRESRGHEIDLIVEGGDRLYAVETKSGATIATEHLTVLRSFVESCANDAEQAHREVVARLVHGGRERQRRSDIDVLPWREVQDASW